MGKARSANKNAAGKLKRVPRRGKAGKLAGDGGRRAAAKLEPGAGWFPTADTSSPYGYTAQWPYPHNHTGLGCECNAYYASHNADALPAPSPILHDERPMHGRLPALAGERVRTGDFNPDYGSYTAGEFNSRYDGDPKQDPHCGACAFYRNTDQSSIPFTLEYTGTGGYKHAHAYGDLDPDGCRPQLAPVRNRNA